MSDLTFGWQYYVFNLLYGNWTSGEDAGGASYVGDLKDDPENVTLMANFRANAGAPLGTKVVLTYTFKEGVPTDEYINDFEIIKNYAGYVDEPISQAQKDAARSVFDEISSFADIVFIEAKDGEKANINIFEMDMTGGSGQAAPLTGPDDSTYLLIHRGLYENDRLGELSPDFVLDAWKHTFRHEIGHTLGLSHPVNYHEDPNWPDVIYDPTSIVVPPDEATSQFTVMSYLGHEMFSDENLNYTFSLQYGVEGEYGEESYGLFDIKALQFLYGANETPSAGDDVYSFRAENASTQTIYDSGGIDTIDASNQKHGTVISLHEASFSSIGLVYTEDASEVLFQDNIAIAWDTVIENAVGSEYRDIITGNQGNNRLQGEGGDDRLKGGVGNDTLVGGEGVDRMNGGPGDDVIWAGSGDTSDDVAGGSDGNDTVAGGDGNDRLWGDEVRGNEFDGRDLLYGGGGNDTIKGGGQDDRIFGGAGDDVIDPGWGNDTLTGGDGADVFSIIPYGGVNTITDFAVGEDLLGLEGFTIENLANHAETSTRDGEDGVLLTLENGTYVFLTGLTLSDITNELASF